MKKYSEHDIAFDYPFEKPLYRLIMLYIYISGSGNGGKEKLISDKKFQAACCCSSADFTCAINYLVEQGFIIKCNYGLQFGTATSGYTIAVPDHLREGV